MRDSDRLTLAQVEAAHRELKRLHARIREKGEEAIITELWDKAVDDVERLPEIAALADRFAQEPRKPPRAPTGAEAQAEAEADAIHQAVVRLAQDAQRMGDELRTSGDRAEFNV